MVDVQNLNNLEDKSNLIPSPNNILGSNEVILPNDPISIVSKSFEASQVNLEQVPAGSISFNGNFSEPLLGTLRWDLHSGSAIIGKSFQIISKTAKFDEVEITAVADKIDLSGHTIAVNDGIIIILSKELELKNTNFIAKKIIINKDCHISNFDQAKFETESISFKELNNIKIKELLQRENLIDISPIDNTVSNDYMAENFSKDNLQDNQTNKYISNYESFKNSVSNFFSKLWVSFTNFVHNIHDNIFPSKAAQIDQENFDSDNLNDVTGQLDLKTQETDISS